MKTCSAGNLPAWIKGADLSSLPEVEECGGRFYDAAEKAFPLRGRCPGANTGADKVVSGQTATAPTMEEDALTILKRHGVNLIRLRLWNDPYDDSGHPYGAGTNDLPRTIALARRCKALALPWLLDFHYSDFWADPGKQTLPKAWRALDEDGLTNAVYGFTLATMERLKAEDLLPAIVAPGNEISNGLLWPYGKTPNYMAIARFLSAAIRAIREAAPDTAVMLHLDNGGWNGLYRSWFDSYLINGGADFDCIGLSYYPFWHGTMEALSANLNDLAVRYKKPLIVAETAMGFTLEDYAAREGLSPEERKGAAASTALAEKVAWPMTPGGQCAFLRELAAVLRQVPNGLGRGFIWWEPAWIPVPGSEWATPEALAYTGEAGPGGNEWANQCLFDFGGRALPALRLFQEL